MDDELKKTRAYTDAVIKRIDREMPAELKRFEVGITRAIIKTKGTSEDKLCELYRCIDKYFDFCGKYTPCKKGCCHCCYYKIDVSELEVAHIEKHTGIMREPRFFPIFGTHGMPCPFLRGSDCSIYRFRPYACRKHVTVDETDYWCHTERCNTAEINCFQSSEVKAAYEMIVDTERLADIRNYFPLGTAARVAGRCCAN